MNILVPDKGMCPVRIAGRVRMLEKGATRWPGSM